MPTWRDLGGAVGLAAIVVAACHKVPYTGRTQFNLVPDSVMRGVGRSSYTSLLSGVTVDGGGPDDEVLQAVGGRISVVADQPKYAWEFSLIEEDEVNAWCLPGGYIGFYTGILPVLQNESGMAFVMGHEVAHATARHGSERLSQQLTLLGGLAGLEIYMANQTDLAVEQRAAILVALGVGTTVGVLLPFSRSHEAEADVIGMMYMAEAGYPPDEAARVWERMEASGSTSSMPTFLSTHPANAQRQGNLAEWTPVAQKKFDRHTLRHDTQITLWSGGSEGGRAGSGRGGGRSAGGGPRVR